VAHGEEDNSQGAEEEVVEGTLLSGVDVAAIVEMHENLQAILSDVNDVASGADVCLDGGGAEDVLAFQDGADVVATEIQQSPQAVQDAWLHPRSEAEAGVAKL
jgi:hypothetical protein